MPEVTADPAAQMLTVLADEVRAKTLLILEATPDAWLHWAPPGTQNHIAWHAGHCLWLADALCVEPITGRGELPGGWAETFGMTGRPPARTTDWPEKAELYSRLAGQLVRVKQLLAGLDGERLTRPMPRPARGTLGRLIVHGFHDEANHQGEMYLLFKQRRALRSASARV